MDTLVVIRISAPLRSVISKGHFFKEGAEIWYAPQARFSSDENISAPLKIESALDEKSPGHASVIDHSF